MRNKEFIVILLAFSMSLVMFSQAECEPDNYPADVMTISSDESVFSDDSDLSTQLFLYRGTLKNNGKSVDGIRDMRFWIYGDENCHDPIVEPMSYNVPVKKGVFEVRLELSRAIANGPAIWVETEIDGLAEGCRAVQRQVLDCLSGTTAEIQMEDSAAIAGVNSAERGRGLYGHASGETGVNYGVYGISDSDQGYGGYFSNTTGAYGMDIVAGADDINTDGNISSDPERAGSDLNIYSNDEVRIFLDSDKDEEGSFSVYNDAAEQVFSINENGDIFQALDRGGMVKAAAYVECEGENSSVNNFF